MTFRDRLMRADVNGEPQAVTTAFSAGPGRLLERLLVAELVTGVTLSVRLQLVLVSSLVPEDMTPEQVQRRLLDAVPAEESEGQPHRKEEP